MVLVDWRELYASNRAVIERANGAPANPTPVRRAPADAPGGRHRVVHVPPGLDRATAVPLVCMLHGCTQDARSFAAATRMDEAADRHGFVVVYPEQTARENQRRCWNWFSPDHQRRDGGEPASIAAIVREVMDPASDWTIDPGRVYLAGLSAGGAMAAVLAATYPELFAAVAVHSGLAYRSATSVGAAFGAMSRGSAGPLTARERERQLPTMVVHGSEDRTVHPANADHVLRQAMAGDDRFDVGRPTTTVRGQVTGGHASTTSRWTDRSGAVVHERLVVHGMGHAWSGGAPGTPHTDARGPSAAEAIWRFFAATG